MVLEPFLGSIDHPGVRRDATELERVIEAMSEGIVIHAANGEITQFNAAALSALGLSAEQLMGRTELDDRWGMLRADRTPMPSEEVPSYVARTTGRPVMQRRVNVRLPSGQYSELIVSAVPLHDEGGALEKVVVAFRDVSREAAALDDLHTFERFFELSGDLLAVSSADHRVLQVNGAVGQALGWPREHYLGPGLMALIHPDDARATLAALESSQSNLELSNRLKAKDGRWRHFSWRVAKGKGAHAESMYFWRGHDVTERMRELAELEGSRQLLTEAFELAELAVLERDLMSGSSSATPRLRELLQLSEVPPEGIQLERYVLPEEQELYRQYREKMAKQVALPPHQMRLKTARGEVREVRTWARLTHDERGRVTRELIVIQDMTEQVLFQAKLRLAERLTSLGTMAAGVAHEINNPLAFVLANLNVVKAELGKVSTIPGVDLPDLRDAVNEALDGAERVRQIVLSLKPFARVDEHRRAHCDVARIVQASLNMAKNELRHRARIETDLKPVSPVFANEARLSQVFLNLLVNAAQSMSDTATNDNVVSISTREENGQVVVMVRDTGAGIPPDVLPRIFDPFFSTKQIGDGAGLGLFVSQGIVKEAGGEISVSSMPGVGTTFEVRLPFASATAYGSAVSTPVPQRKRARILLVDDEPSILRSLERLLGKAHEITLAHSGREAVALLSAGLVYDLVICDLMMPEVSGIDVWEQIAPELRQPFVFMTGGTFTQRAERFLAEVKPPLLEKPFTATTLEGLLQRAQSR